MSASWTHKINNQPTASYCCKMGHVKCTSNGHCLQPPVQLVTVHQGNSRHETASEILSRLVLCLQTPQGGTICRPKSLINVWKSWIMVFWILKQCSLISGYQCLRMNALPPISGSHNRLHGVIIQQATMHVFSTLKTSNSIWTYRFIILNPKRTESQAVLTEDDVETVPLN